MSLPPQADAEVASTADRILMEAHEAFIRPQLEAAAAASRECLKTSETFARLGEAHCQLRIRPAPETGSLCYEPRDHPTGGTPPFDPLFDTLATAWAEADDIPFSGYVLDRPDGQTDWLLLALVLGGRENFRSFRGSFILAWCLDRSGEFPFDHPTLGGSLPKAGNARLLPLPAHIETSRRAPEQEWTRLPHTIKRLPEWTELEQTVATVARIGTRLREQILPVLADAAWKSMAGRVMHEVSDTVSMPRSTLNKARGDMNSALGTIRRARLPGDEATELKLTGHIRSIETCLKQLEADQEYVESKVRWFFQLVAEDTRSESLEKSGVRAIIRHVAEALGYDFEQTCELVTPKDPLWERRLRLPRYFPQHCFAALLRNAFIHRDSLAPVRLTLERAGSGLDLTWSNRLSSSHRQALEGALAMPVSSRTFGLRMMHAISVFFFKQPLDIRIEGEAPDSFAIHRLHLPAALLASPETNVSAPQKT